MRTPSHTAPRRGQGLVEFALVLPVLLMMILGMIEVARMLAIFSSVSSAARQAARYGSVGGDNGFGQQYFLDCAGMRSTAMAAGRFAGLTESNVQVSYERPVVSTGHFTRVGTCAADNRAMLTSDAPMTNVDINDGFRVVLTVTAYYDPIVSLVPLPSIPFSFVAARTIFKSIEGPTPTPKPAPDLAVTALTSNPPSVVPYDDVQYGIQVRNNGPASTFSTGAVTLSQTVPSGWTYSGAYTGAGWACASQAVGGVITCTHSANIAVGVTKALSITLTASVGQQGSYTTTVRAISARGDANPANNARSVSTSVIPIADLIITKTVPLVYALPSTPLTYTINVTNMGPNVLTNQDLTTVTDTVPASATFLTAAGTGWSCNHNTVTRIVTCTRSTSLASGASFPIIIFRVMTPATNATLVNTAGVTTTKDLNRRNNTSAPVTTTITTDADVSIVKFASANQVGPDDTLLYTLRVTNNGAASANGVVVNDTLPTGLNFVSAAAGAGWSPCAYNAGNRTVTCSYASALPVGTAADIVITLRVPSNASRVTVSNQATVTATTNDPNPSNNTSNAVTTQIYDCHPGVVNAGLSTIGAAPITVQADGADATSVVVTLRDNCYEFVNGRSVTLSSSRGSADTIAFPNPGVTANGQVIFQVRSSSIGASTYSATEGTIVLNSSAVSYVCVGGFTMPSTDPRGVAFRFTNDTGLARRLHSITITWPTQTNGRLTSLSFGGVTIFTGNLNAATLTFGAGGQAFNQGSPADRDIPAGGSKDLIFGFDYNVSGTGTYRLSNIQWDNQAGASICTTAGDPPISAVP